MMFGQGVKMFGLVNLSRCLIIVRFLDVVRFFFLLFGQGVVTWRQMQIKAVYVVFSRCKDD